MDRGRVLAAGLLIAYGEILSAPLQSTWKVDFAVESGRRERTRALFQLCEAEVAESILVHIGEEIAVRIDATGK